MNIWEGVSEFVAVAEANSFTAAAKRLGISIAQVSRQVSALEKRLATKLLIRTTRKVSLTEFGSIYYHQCRRVLDGLEEAERSITDLHNIPTGKLKVTAPATFGERWIAPLIHDFINLYPDLELELYLTNRTVDLIDEGFDLAIRVGNLDDSSMIAKKLASRTLFICASPSYIAKHGEPHSLTELSNHNCIKGSHDYWHFLVDGKRKNISVTGNIKCNNGSALLDAAIKGLGIVQLPDYYVLPFIQQKKLLPFLLQYQEPEEQIWALYPNNRFLSAKVQLLIKHLAANLPERMNLHESS